MSLNKFSATLVMDYLFIEYHILFICQPIELPHQKSTPNTFDASDKKSTPNHFHYRLISSILEEEIFRIEGVAGDVNHEAEKGRDQGITESIPEIF